LVFTFSIKKTKRTYSKWYWCTSGHL